MVPLRVIAGALPGFFAVLKTASAVCRFDIAVSIAGWFEGFALVSTAVL